MINVIEKLIPVPSLRRSGQKIKGVAFIVAHDTGNDGSTADQNVTYFINSAKDTQASAHYFVDDKQIIRCIPEEEKAWHVRYDVPKDNQLYGKDANDWSIGVELCFSSKGSMDNGKSYQNYVDLMASLCQKYHIDPTFGIVGHYLLDPTRRTDPINAFKFIGRTWETFIADVVAALKALNAPSPSQPQPAPSITNDAIKRSINTKLQEIDDLVSQIK